MSPRGARIGGLLVASLPVALLASAWLALGDRPILALAPPLLLAGLLFLARARLSTLVTLLVLAAILFDDPAANPMQGRWRSPLTRLGALLYENLDTALGLSALHFSLLDLTLVVLLGILLTARFRGEQPALDLRLRPLALTLSVAFLAVVGMEAWGLARGGDFRQSLWQLRQLLWLGPLTLLCLVTFTTDRSRRILVNGLMGATVIRAGFGLYYWLVYCRPVGFAAHYVTTHSDSALFVLVLVLLLHDLVEHRDLKHLALALTAGPLVAGVMVLNDRRLAYVILALALVALLALLRRPARRRLVRAGLLASPVLVLYVAIGLGAQSKVFAPVRALRSVGVQEDASSRWRRMEDLNLVLTLHDHPLVGQGFGHPYREFVPVSDISQFFAQYRYLPHNSVLWLLLAGGVVGFTAVWMVLPVLVLLAARAYRLASGPGRRRVAVAALVAVIAFEVQAFGDIGLQDWTPTLLLASLGAAAANLAVATGALGPRRLRARAAHVPGREPLPAGGVA